jgi:hypothetical protein
VSTIEERVARGAAYLDATENDWLTRIDLGRLNLLIGVDCIWGQLVGGYSLRPKEVDDGEAFGFNADYRQPEDTWVEAVNELEAEWRRVITERRAAA